MGEAQAVTAMFGSVIKNVGVALDYGAQEQAHYRNISEYKRSAALENANAVDALRQGEQDAGHVRLKAAEMVARQRLGFANSGVDATVGTPTAVSAATSMWAELDAQTASNNALRKAFGYKEAARKYKQAAKDEEKQLEADKTKMILTMAGNTLSSAGGSSGSYNNTATNNANSGGGSQAGDFNAGGGSSGVA